MKRIRTKSKRKVLLILVSVLIIAIVSTLLTMTISKDLVRSRTAGVKQSIQIALVQCYASEGIYPSSLEYLEEHYGLIINHEKYLIDYFCYASNQMPSINVLVR